MPTNRSEILRKIVKPEYVDYFWDWEEKTAREKEKQGLDVISHIFATRGTKKYPGMLLEDKVKTAITSQKFE